MSQRTERAAILADIEQGRITAVEGIRRLTALDAALQAESTHGGEPDRGDAVLDAPTFPGSVVGSPIRSEDHEHETAPAVTEATGTAGAAGTTRTAGTSGAAGARRVLRLRIGDASTGGDRLRVSLPLGLAEAGMRLLSRLDPQGDWSSLTAALRDGDHDPLFELESADGERVVVTVE